MPHRISFAVTSRNEDPAVLTATLDGLLATSNRYWREIVLVDDGSANPVSYPHPEVIVLRNTEPVGVCPSRRQALAAAGGNVFVVLDPHMTFQPDWLDRMLEHVDSRALLCARWMDYERTTTYCWGANFAWARPPHPGFAHIGRNRPPRRAAPDVPMVIGACYMMRRDAYEQLGGFCPLFRIWGKDEPDMSVRAWLAGLGVKCVASAGVGHLSRKFPFQVTWDHTLFNEVVMIRTVFEERTASLLEEYLEPLSVEIQNWLKEADLAGWRALVQSRRRISDAEFFSRYAPAVPLSFKKGVTLKRGHVPPSRLRTALDREERELAAAFAKQSSAEVLASGYNAPIPAFHGYLTPRVGGDAAEMAELDALPWACGATFLSFGVRVGIRVNDADLPREFVSSLPPAWEPLDSEEVDVLYSVMLATSESIKYRLYAGASCVCDSSALTRISLAFQAALENDIAVLTPQYWFVRAGVVGWKNRAIVLPGDRLSGIQPLVAELVSAGGTYYSGTYAVFDSEGLVHAFPKPFELTGPEGVPLRWPVDSASGQTSRPPLPVGWVASIRYRPGAQCHLQPATSGKTLLALMQNSLIPEDRQADAFALFGRAIRSAAKFRGTRGNVHAMARALLRCADAP